MQAFKHKIDPRLVESMGRQLQRVWPRFPQGLFVAQAGQGLEALELKARAMHLADALEATLPATFGDAAEVLEAALAPAWPDHRLGSDDAGPEGLEGWALWPVGEFVVRRGLAHPERALACLHALTQRFSAEFAIRPFIVAHPMIAFDTLQRWTQDPSAHVRRLVSEGSRPRLPWGLRLQALVRDPAPTLPLLAALQDDPSPYVRRSVANHLNDIAKDHPACVVAWVERHLPAAPAPRQALLRHASRSLVKAGDAAMLRAWGLQAPADIEVRLQLRQSALALGESLVIDITLHSRASRPQRLVIDYAVHHLKADGRRTAKVFKGWVLELAAGETRQLCKRHSLRPVTTRRYYPGRQGIDLRLNGQVLAELPFDLTT